MKENNEIKKKELEAETEKVSCWEWLKDELKPDRELISIKFILFCYTGGSAAFFPYLTLHMQQLGITMKEIAIIYAILPVGSILGPPISGMIADRMGQYKVVVVLNIFLATVLHVLLLYIPTRTPNPLTFSCGPNGNDMTWATCDYCHHERNNSDVVFTLEECSFKCDSPPEELQLCLTSGLNVTSCRSFDVADEIQVNGTLLSVLENDTCIHAFQQILHEEKVYQTLTCPSSCPVQCKVTGSPHCLHPDDPSNNPYTFWIYFFLRTIATFFLASGYTMLDATTLAILKDKSGELGKQRLLMMLGLASMPVLSGLLVDYYSEDLGYSDYMPAFYMGGAFTMTAALLVMRLQFKVDVAGEDIWHDLRSLFTRLEIDIFLVMVLILGANLGYLENFLFVFLKDLDAPNVLLGLTLTVGHLVGIPLMFMADKIINKVGRATIFTISFMAYALRHLGYAHLTNPWWTFPLELLEVLTYELMWVAATNYCPVLAPKGLLATMTGLAGATYYSVGRGVGSLLGGYLIASIGLSNTFLAFSSLSFASGILYIIIYFTYLRKVMLSDEDVKERERQEAEEAKAMLDADGRPAVIVTPKEQQNSSTL
ncbi:major facilitator superfamily domain-containing protein 6-like isoform X1 [Macrobrachium nipponense]|uniref:major facilitator superfamily domain-containing protein 6-like isoform X1 n=2 Tax=Macrobrachium nipponense TaxID=159736 RepID=UPI0030C82E7C